MNLLTLVTSLFLKLIRTADCNYLSASTFHCCTQPVYLQQASNHLVLPHLNGIEIGHCLLFTISINMEHVTYVIYGVTEYM